MSRNTKTLIVCLLALSFLPSRAVFAEGEWEVTPESEAALEAGLEWLANNQTEEGNWGSKHLGLVSMGALAFLSAGHMPGRGRYGEVVEKALDYVISNARTANPRNLNPGVEQTDEIPPVLLNIEPANRDMYNHGLSTFVLGQAYGMTNDPELTNVLDGSLKLIYQTQCKDGGWDYEAKSQDHGHDLSLAVMQAKAIRSAMDSGLEVPSSVIQLAIKSVREHYKAENTNIRSQDAAEIRVGPGQFTYDGNRVTVAMSAAGVVCLQEFGQYDDWRIEKNMEFLRKHVLLQQKHATVPLEQAPRNGNMPFDAYTLYYVGQALYQVGGEDWEVCYPILRDCLVRSQRPIGDELAGSWEAGQWVSGQEGRLYGTAVACFILAMPNRYLPILQEGKIEGIRQKIEEN